MEALSETHWDVVISGTGLQQSLLALALSRSDKKVLHVDENEYYGGPEAAFSLQEAEEWVTKIGTAPSGSSFLRASLWKAESNSEILEEVEKLSFSRAYTLTLSPQIIYSKSKLLSQLVSSKVYRQLEFQAVGNWWIYGVPELDSRSDDLPGNTNRGTLKRIPNGREDVFSDTSIDVRAKRGLMKFLKFVIDFENQSDVWELYSQSSLPEFLSSKFQLSGSLQTVILALTLSLDIPSDTTVQYALPRIARHLTSIGVFGPGFGAVIPKWGGGSEIAQVACRAGAVGGGVYILGAGISNTTTTSDSEIELQLTNNEVVRSNYYVYPQDAALDSATETSSAAKMIAIASSDLASLFTSTVEGAPTAAVSVVAFPAGSLLVDSELQDYPVFAMVHSSDTGECPIGQCVLYLATSSTGKAKSRLEAAVSALLQSYLAIQDPGVATSPHAPRLLYSMYYEQSRNAAKPSESTAAYAMPPPSLDLAFDDSTLDHVEEAWRKIMQARAGSDQLDEPDAPFMEFAEREHMGPNDEDDDERY